MALSYIMDQNALIVGEPGFGKTTAAKVLCSTMSGYPFDLYEAAQIQGHPDQTFETMIARLDFSKLSQEERVIWLLSAYLPARIIDEVNRLPGGNQDEILNALETGRFSYLNSTNYQGKAPFFGTANNPDDGNHVLIPPIRDRFTVHEELGYIGATYEDDIENAEDNHSQLRDPELTDAIIAVINDKNLDVKQRLEKIDKLRKVEGGYLDRLASDKSDNLRIFTKEDKYQMQARIRAVKLNDDAKVLLKMIQSELNTSPKYGRKRSNDPVDDEDHAKKLASSKVENAASPRATVRGIKRYSQALAYLSGAEEVTKDYLRAVAPHALGHRLEFTEAFKGRHEADKREGQYGCTREMHLASKLMKDGNEGIEANYESVKKTLDLALTAFTKPETLTLEQRGRMKELISDKRNQDHPLIQEYVGRLQREKKDAVQRYFS